MFSFNANRSVTTWTEFSWNWYIKAWHNEGIQSAALMSFEVATISAVLATIMATMAARPLLLLTSR